MDEQFTPSSTYEEAINNGGNYLWCFKCKEYTWHGFAPNREKKWVCDECGMERSWLRERLPGE